jgi:prepilin-type N-terminal cleavage/methylation domain-containing protein
MGKQLIKGFTIVELLIVVVVIAILAAITIVAYNGIQNRSHDSAVQNDLVMFFKKMENARTLSGTNQYPAATGPAINAEGVLLTRNSYSTNVTNNISYCRTTDGLEIGIAAASKSGNRFYISSTSNGVKTYTPSWTNAAATTCNTTLSSAGFSSGYNNGWGLTSGTWNYGV